DAQPAPDCRRTDGGRLQRQQPAQDLRRTAGDSRDGRRGAACPGAGAMNDWLPEYNTLVVLAGGSLLGCSAGVIGCFALLKRRALTGDALAHASLPGLCIAYLIVGSRSMPALLLGALLSGVAGITILALLRRWTRIKEDTALGIVLSVPYGLG